MVQVGYFHGYIDGVDWVFVDHPAYHAVRDSIYSGNNRDILFRCALLCKAALEAPWHLPCGGSVYGEDNLVFIANDWHTALLPFYLQVRGVPSAHRLWNTTSAVITHGADSTMGISDGCKEHV